ncbi:MAG TPA: DUF3488 and transglutaminase-like domain-containing protein [Chloroflexia bacterium]|nr:DUF3488 and transglutaminase-like domain-containing protein [Chloroflexia bacterium]
MMTKLLRLREGWLMVGLLALMIFSVVWSIQRAGWSEDLFILTPIALLGMAVGLVLSKVRGVPRLLLHLTGAMTGLVLVLWETASLLDDPRLFTIQDRVQDLLGRLVLWIRAVMTSDMSDDLPLFILSVAVLTWVLAYASTWFVFRSRWLWWAIIPNAVALMINVSYSAAALSWYFVFFLMAALLLMVRFNMFLHEERWERERVNYSPGLRWSFLRASSVFAVIVAVLMWYMPTQAVNQTLSQAWDQASGPWQDLEKRWSSAFAGVPGSGNFGYSTFNDSWALGGSLNLSDAVALRVQTNSTRRLYWRANIADFFDGRGWKNTAEQTFHSRKLSSNLALDANQPLRSIDAQRVPVTATVQLVHTKRNLIFAPLRAASFDRATRLVVSWRDLRGAQFHVPGADPGEAPIELQPLLDTLANARRAAIAAYDRNADDPGVGGQPLPAGAPADVARVVLAQVDQANTVNSQIDGLRDRGIDATVLLNEDLTFEVQATGPVPVYDDLSAVYSADRLQANDVYEVESLISDADIETLRAAGTDYPDWVLNRYRQLPNNLPGRVFDKAYTVVNEAKATTPYDKAIAIQDFLRTYKYNTHISLPPPGRNSVDYFLFEGKEGYCEYYSSAMVVMLRALGIPAREATGYAPGEYDDTTGEWVIRESSSHAWPEVYFPGAGWVEFEPTPSQGVIERPATAGAPRVTPTPSDALTPAARPTSRANDPDQDTPTPVGGGAAANTGDGGTIAANAALLLGLLALVAAIGALLWRRERARAIASGRLVMGGIQYYERLVKLAWWLGLRPRASDTPYEFADQVAREVPGAGSYVTPIARAYVRERFGQHRPDRGEQQDLARAWMLLRNRLLRRISEAQRWMARR